MKPRSNELVRDEWVPAKECEIIPGQPYPKDEVTIEQEAEFIKYAASTPEHYKTFLVDTAIKHLSLANRIEKRPLRVKCHVLVPPVLQYGKSVEEQGPRKGF